jgi:hypothetical protein
MTTSYTPQSHAIWNEFDKLGLLLGLSRLPDEKNAEYKQRLLDVFVHRSDSTYQGLINGITRELGFSLYEAMTIKPIIKGDGSALAPNPGIVFKDTKCYIYLNVDETEEDPSFTFDRFDHSGDSFTYRELIQNIEDTGYFNIELIDGVNENTRSMSIFNQKSIKLISAESINKGGSIISLENDNLIPESFNLISSNLTERVTVQEELILSNQYYVDFAAGVVYTTQVPSSDSRVRYKCRNDDFSVMASPVILLNLQSSDIQTKMFEQVAAIDGSDDINGAPTAFGADLINELLSISGIAWGE